MSRRVRFALVMICSVICLGLAVSAVVAADAGTTTASALDNKEPGKGETSVGCLIADAIRSAGRSDIAFVSAGDLKSAAEPIAAGKIDSGAVSSMLSYPDDAVAVMTLDGQMVRAALERSLSMYPRSGLSFLQVSGMKVVFDPSRPEGSRVVSVSVGNKPLLSDQSYTVAVPSSLASGAVGYWKVWSKRNIVSRPDTVTCAKAIEDFLKSNPKLDYTNLNRILAGKQ